MRFVRLLLIFLLAVGLSRAYAHAENSPSVPGIKKWASTHYIDHPLVGKIIDQSGDHISAEQLLSKINQHSTILIGEAHDNPDHHKIQAALISGFKPQSKMPVQVVFEMVPAPLQPQLGAADVKSDPELQKLGKALKWEERGWYAWAIYKPIFDAALNREFKLTAGNIERTKTRALSKNGLEALSKEEQTALALNKPLTEAQNQSLFADLKTSHCGLMPDRALPAMALAQRARDGAMANALNADTKTASILIAGNGHVRKDRGVPRLIVEQNPYVIGLIEVDPDDANPANFMASGTGDPLYDVAIFTPKFDITDHCAEMRKHFKSKEK